MWIISALLVMLAIVLTGPAKGAKLFVAEPGLNQVSEYDLATGAFIDSYSVSRPVDVAIGPDGNLYVASQTKLQADLAEIIKVDLTNDTPTSEIQSQVRFQVK